MIQNNSYICTKLHARCFNHFNIGSRILTKALVLLICLYCTQFACNHIIIIIIATIRVMGDIMGVDCFLNGAHSCGFDAVLIAYSKLLASELRAHSRGLQVRNASRFLFVCWQPGSRQAKWCALSCGRVTVLAHKLHTYVYTFVIRTLRPHVVKRIDLIRIPISLQIYCLV